MQQMSKELWGLFTPWTLLGGGCWPRLPEQNAERSSCGWLVGLVCAEAGLRCERIASSTRRETPAYPAIGTSAGPPPPFFPTSVLSFVLQRAAKFNV
jgi:hypothetical protein